MAASQGTSRKGRITEITESRSIRQSHISERCDWTLATTQPSTPQKRTKRWNSAFRRTKPNLQDSHHWWPLRRQEYFPNKNPARNGQAWLQSFLCSRNTNFSGAGRRLHPDVQILYWGKNPLPKPAHQVANIHLGLFRSSCWNEQVSFDHHLR